MANTPMPKPLLAQLLDEIGRLSVRLDKSEARFRDLDTQVHRIDENLDDVMLSLSTVSVSPAVTLAVVPDPVP